MALQENEEKPFCYLLFVIKKCEKINKHSVNCVEKV